MRVLKKKAKETIRLKTKDAKVKDLLIKGYNAIGGDKKEILNALMNHKACKV